VEGKNIEYNVFYPILCLQVGFQLWAIPVGLSYVDESTLMILHHVSVIIVACMAGFCTFGF
jgi:hypothetical protein